MSSLNLTDLFNHTLLNEFSECNLTELLNGSNLDCLRKNGVQDVRKGIYQVMMPPILCFCMVSLLLSLSIVCSFPFVKRPISPTIRLSLSLSAANSAFSAVVFVAILVHSYLPYAFEMDIDNCLKLTVEALRLGVILVQVYHLLAVALVHYFGTLKPLQYAYILTPRCLKLLITFLWIFPISSLFIGFSSIPDQGFQSEKCQNNNFWFRGITFRLIWSMIYFGPTIILVLVYLHIFFILQKRGKDIIISEHKKKISKNLKTVKTTGLIVGTFLIGWCPAVLCFLLICDECPIQVTDMNLSIAIFSTTYVLFILKVFVDTFIYALRLPEIREALRLLFGNVVRKCGGSQSKTEKYFRSGSSSTRTSNLKSTYFNSRHSSSVRDKNLISKEQFSPVKSSGRSFTTIELRPLCNEDINNTSSPHSEVSPSTNDYLVKINKTIANTNQL